MDACQPNDGLQAKEGAFCDGKTFFDDAALKAALGGCAASPRGEEYYYQEMKAASMYSTLRFPPPSSFLLPSVGNPSSKIPQLSND